MNSNGKPIDKIECSHFKKYINLPITCYDFRRSLATFCLDNKDQTIRNAEASVLRHNEYTGFSYYYGSHSNNVEKVNIEYAKKHNLIHVSPQDIDAYTEHLKSKSFEDDWELTQRRLDKAMDVRRQAILKRKHKQDQIKEKGTRHLILPSEYNCLLEAIEAAVNKEIFFKVQGLTGPFSQLIKYLPSEGGMFPPNQVWYKDFMRILFGLEGEKGDNLRKADLTVYDGDAFGKYSGRKKIEDAKKKNKNCNPYMIVSEYWRYKVSQDTRSTVKGKWNQIKYAFNSEQLQYYKERS